MTYEKQEHVVEKADGSELMIMNMNTGEIFTLLEVSQDIWNGVSQGKDRDAIARDLIARYDVSEDDASRDVEEFIQQLFQHGFIRSKA